MKPCLSAIAGVSTSCLMIACAAGMLMNMGALSAGFTGDTPGRGYDLARMD